MTEARTIAIVVAVVVVRQFQNTKTQTRPKTDSV